MEKRKIIDRMERLSACWKAQFDNPPEELPLHWTVDATGMLRLDGHTVCRADEVATTVMYFGLMLYAYNMIGQDKLDDLILWSECYANNPEVMAIIVEDDLPEDLSEECREFVAENEIAPSGFVDAATAAVAVLTGAIYDPFGETI